MSVLLLNVKVVEISGVGLLDLLGHAEMLLPCLLWRHNLHIVHVYLVHSVVSLAPIQLSEYDLSKLIVGHKVSGLVPSDQLVHLGVHGHLVLVELRLEVVGVHVPLRVLLDRLRHLLLVLINSCSWGPSLFVSGASVEIEIIGIHRWVIGAILLWVFLHTQSLTSYSTGRLT